MDSESDRYVEKGHYHPRSLVANCLAGDTSRGSPALAPNGPSRITTEQRALANERGERTDGA